MFFLYYIYFFFYVWFLLLCILMCCIIILLMYFFNIMWVVCLYDIFWSHFAKECNSCPFFFFLLILNIILFYYICYLVYYILLMHSFIFVVNSVFNKNDKNCNFCPNYYDFSSQLFYNIIQTIIIIIDQRIRSKQNQYSQM